MILCDQKTIQQQYYYTYIMHYVTDNEKRHKF
jgi:hypothetical protein